MPPDEAAARVASLGAPAASANVINVEFKFTPFVGDPATQDQVETVPGIARVFINNVPFADQQVGRSEVPVLFEEREIAPAVWLPAESCGPALRKGQNTLRLEFEPADPQASYRAQLRWATVMDEAVEQSEPGRYSATNQAGEGVDEKAAKGKVVFEREFTADFAADMPWHHYPAVSTLGAEDRAAIAAPAAGELDMVTTGHAEVVVRAPQGQLFFPVDPSVFERIEGDELQMALGMALSLVYPPRLVVVRSPSGAWEVVY